jgi:hypothetical protein
MVSRSHIYTASPYYTASLYAILAACSLALTPIAHAVDGVLEINQTCAMNTGCFSGDAAGFPVTLTSTGSYRLTSNLTQTGPSNAIDINAARVSIDLNGFTIECVADDDCPAPHGIAANFNSYAIVRNGTVTGFGNHGVSLWANALVEQIRSTHNLGDGIATQTASRVIDSIGTNNGGSGIYIDFGSTVSGSTALNNGSNGITAGQGSTITHNTSMVNFGHGVSTSAGSTVLGNTVRGNSGFGLNMSSNVGYGHNSITNNNGGDVNPQTTGGIQMGTNVCGLNTICP